MVNIKTDSRKIVPGDIYVALPGISSDGHDYIDKAIKNGATKLIVSKLGNYGIDTLLVDDTRKYLNDYLKDNYGDIVSKMTMIGITGTNGKTTTAYLINDALNKLGIKSAYAGTVGFYTDRLVRPIANTTPEISDMYSMIVEAYEQGCRFFVTEASSQGLAMNRLDTINFDYAIFTNLTEDHLDYHKNMENYALAKQQLFKKLKSNGKAIINNDDPYKNYFLLPNNHNITYGKNPSNYRLIDNSCSMEGSNFKFIHNGEVQSIDTNLVGDYNIYNALVTAVILNELGISKENIKKVMNKVEMPKGRMEVVNYKDNKVIIDYAHTPDALKKVIETAKQFTDGNVYVTFGCTGDREREKRPVMTKIATDLANKVIITSDDLHNENPNQIVSDMLNGLNNKNYEVCMDRKEAIRKGIDLLDSKDTLIIAGKGHEDAIVVGKERIPFNDREEAQKYIDEKLNQKVLIKDRVD